MASIGNLYASLSLKSATFDNGLRRSAAQVRRTQGEMDRGFSGMAKSATRSFAMITAAASAVGFGALLGKIAQVNMEYQKLNGMLVTATGSTQNAARSMAELQKFAATTPFSLAQTTEAFVKLRNLGLNPSMAALKSYGNTASAMGKDLMQLIEAVADASTGEFERLKEFGIKSKQEGEKVKFTFQGVTTTVQKNAADIQKYLLGIGNTQFAGAMDRQAQTLGGAFSNLGDTMAQLAVTFGEAGFAPALEEAIRGLESSSGSIENFARQMGALTGTTLGLAVQGLTAIANNLELVKAAFITVSTVIATRYVTSMLAANSITLASIGINRSAVLGMMAYASVAPVLGTVTMAFAGLRAAAAGLLALVGGPLGIAVAAITYGLVTLATESYETQAALDGIKASGEETSRALEEARDRAKEAGVNVTNLGGAAHGSHPFLMAIKMAYDMAADAAEKLGINARFAAIEMAKANITKLRLEQEELGLDRTARNIGGGTQLRAGSEAAAFVGIGPSRESRLEGIKALDRQIAMAQDTLALTMKTPPKAFLPKEDKPTSSGGGGGGKPAGGRSGGSSPAEQAAKQAKQVSDSLDFQAEQIRRTQAEQEVYNTLRSAGLITEQQINSEMGQQIAKKVRDNQEAQKKIELDKTIADMMDDYTAKQEELGKNERELALLAAERAFENDILEEGNIIADARIIKMKELINLYYDQKEALEAVRKAEEEGNAASRKWAEEQDQKLEEEKRQREQIGRQMADIGIRAFDGLIKGTMSFGDFFRSIITDLGQLMLETLVYEPIRKMMEQWAANSAGGLFGSLFGLGGGGGGGGIIGAITGAVGGGVAPVGKAMGGPVEAGRPYYVGERGAEMFVPDRSGMILPNRKMGGSSTTVSPTYNIMLSGNPEANQQTLAQIKKAQAEQNAYIRQQNQKKGWK